MKPPISHNIDRIGDNLYRRELKRLSIEKAKKEKDIDEKVDKAIAAINKWFYDQQFKVDMRRW